MKVKAKEVQWYDHRTQTMAKSQKYKIQKILEQDRIVPFCDGYLCLPIKDYNKRTYNIKWDGTRFTCTCQHYVMKKTPCSHIGSIWEYLAIHDEKQLQLL